jgi:hypothetical protein
MADLFDMSFGALNNTHHVELRPHVSAYSLYNAMMLLLDSPISELRLRNQPEVAQ